MALFRKVEMRRVGRVFGLGILFSCGVVAQRFPLRYAGDLGHLKVGQRAISIGATLAETVESGVIRLTGTDRRGKTWRVFENSAGGWGWTTAWRGDFDQDGQEDVLVGSYMPSMNADSTQVSLLILLFDAAGRPVPWRFTTELPRSEDDKFPFLPVETQVRNPEGRAEFMATTGEVTSVYEARQGRLIGFPEWPILAEGIVEELHGPEIGCRVWHRVPALGIRLTELFQAVPIENPCKDSPGATISVGSRQLQGWPYDVFFDGPEGREVYLGQGFSVLTRVMRRGYSVRVREGENGLRRLEVETGRPGRPADLKVDLQVAARKDGVQQWEEGRNGCRNLRHSWGESDGSTILSTCGGVSSWEEISSGTIVALLPDRRTVRTAHTAMNHTVISKVQYQAPSRGLDLVGASDMGEWTLTQWSVRKGGREFAVHDGEGKLVVHSVEVATMGDLISGRGGLAFAVASGKNQVTVTDIRARLRWSRR